MEKAEIVKRLIKEAGYSKRAFAEKIGLPPTTLQSMLSRGIGKASVDNVIKVCKGLGITTDDLEELANHNNGTINEEATIYETIRNDQSNITYIPIIGSVAAGMPILAEENIEGYLPMLSTFLNKRKTYFYLTVTGTSMNLEFPDGSYVLVEKTPFVENGQIAVVKVNGYDATVKKISKSGNIITLIPLSNDPIHEPQTYDLSTDDIKIIGRVVQAVKNY
ncbi:LexA family transcriptional regulator [Bacillus pseudomycoides]|uniref:LexA family protein n=1 Tax=Bacillus pseudomycoides TaxID=64104 RepID=UPI000BEBB148|nr:XRE family transcriptional regulator [Bacillus pseudomycoides]PEF72068.1 LexA family transcriptional regulator [Bacillus pseudomycoides]PEL85511.1 LexA family transcriptional regulator [Bacillus pseudomycoides]PHC37053.1 LexA family transcriptional regulator [Bacillus pseudomycoides]PHC77444.1 LexA family transcriptional regulator [Bacillus pseudomycoides]